jgi:predicted O-methyltransferase YrrM
MSDVETFADRMSDIESSLGTFVDALEPFGSEVGSALTLYSLVVSIRAVKVAEIGRFKGYSTVALALALKRLNDEPWKEPEQHKQRPYLNYEDIESRSSERELLSIDPVPRSEAERTIGSHGLSSYVRLFNGESNAYSHPDKARLFDVVLIDGDHREEQTVRDFVRFERWVRPGGYLLIHDYYGYYDESGVASNPVRRAIDRIRGEYKGHESVVIDTNYLGLWLVRKPQVLSKDE